MSILDTLATVDPEISQAIDNELNRQRNKLELIASENIVSKAVSLIPKSSINSALFTFVFCVPFAGLVHTALTIPISTYPPIFDISRCSRLSSAFSVSN